MLELVADHLRASAPKMEVLEASDGDEAWRLARERLPDLVVLDVMMPGMSGWEVCRKIRQDAALAHTGVLMLTGIGENLNEATSPLFGADEYIDKPFDFEKLDEKIVTVLRRRAVQREAVPRPHPEPAGDRLVDNGVGGPAKPAVRRRASQKHRSGSTRLPAEARKSRVAEAAGGNSRKSPNGARKTKKGTSAMAAKKGAKKAARPVAKKAAKKVAKKGAKKTARKAAKKAKR